MLILTGATETAPSQFVAKTGMAGQEMALVVYQGLDDGGRRVGDGDGDDDDPKPMRRRGRPAVSTAAKSKMEQEALLIDRSSSSCCEVSDDNYDDLLEGYKKGVQDRDHAVQQLRAYESRIPVMKKSLKKLDVQMKKMVKASAKKKLNQAIRKLATAPW